MDSINFENYDDLINERIEFRNLFVEKARKYFQSLGAIEMHLLGSIGRNESDELSDIDIWITFEDQDIEKIIQNRFEHFAYFSPILLSNENTENAPKGGSYSLILYGTPAGPQQVDIYLAPKSTSRITNESKVLFDNSEIEKGEWILNGGENQNQAEKDKIDFLIAMSFIAIKYIVRKDWEFGFIDFILEKVNKSGFWLKAIAFDEKQDAKQRLETIWSELNKVTNEEQKKALESIKAFGLLAFNKTSK